MPIDVYVLLGGELVQFLYDDEQVGQMLDLFFDGWPWKFGTIPETHHVANRSILTRLEFQLVEAIDQVFATSSSRRIFNDQGSQTSVFEDGAGWRLLYANNAIAYVPRVLPGAEEVVIRVQLTLSALASGRLEDIIFSSLAPILRSHGIFLIHAFAVASNGKAVLLVGESGSGKTTTGLSLASLGWCYLANDVVIIKELGGQICAYPTPGGIGIDANSYTLLRNLSEQPEEQRKHQGKRYLPATRLVKGWATSSAPISRILFPLIEESCEIELQAVPDAVTHARLMEGSVDRWDSSSLENHMLVLATLSRQATGYDLRINRALEQLPAILDQVL